LYRASYDRDGVASYQSQVRCASPFIGSLAALLFQDRAFRAWATRWLKVLVFPSVIALLYAMDHFDRLPPLFESVSIALLIVA